MTIDDHRAAGTCSVCGGSMNNIAGGANLITATEYRHGGCGFGSTPWERMVRKLARPHVRFTLVHPFARQPTRATPGSTGWDLYAAEPMNISARQGVTVDTGIALEPPAGWAYSVRPRSGLSRKGVWAATGTIDQDYRGTVRVTLWNLGNVAHYVSPGDRIAQLVLEPVHACEWEEAAALGETERSSRGFGSTGI